MYGLHTAPACTLCLYTVHASEHNVQSVRILCRFSEADGRDEGKERETSWQTERDAGSLCYPSVCLAAVWLMRQFLTLSGHSLITCSQTHTSIFIAGLCISTITHTHTLKRLSFNWKYTMPVHVLKPLQKQIPCSKEIHRGPENMWAIFFFPPEQSFFLKDLRLKAELSSFWIKLFLVAECILCSAAYLNGVSS